MIRHRVQQGECLATIAHGHGFLWQTIYNAPENAELRRRRPNPNVLFPGDEIVIPERHPVTARVATGRQHTFKVPRQAWELRLRLRDHDHSAVAGIPWTLTVEGGGEPTMGTTGGDGLIAVPVASSARRAVLEVFGRQYSFEIGGLDPVSRVTGVQQRLVRLGYDPGAIDGVAGQRTRAAVRAFQASQEDLDDTGRIDDETRLRLQEMCDEDGRHGDLEDEVEGDVESPENSEPVVADTDSGDDVQDHHGSMDDL